LRACKSNPRTHSRKQIQQICESIKRFRFCNPILIDQADQILAGHGRLEAAKLLGLTNVPTLRLSHLSPADKRAYVIADNRLAELAGWDREILAIELQGLLDLDFDLELTGFRSTISRSSVMRPNKAAARTKFAKATAVHLLLVWPYAVPGMCGCLAVISSVALTPAMPPPTPRSTPRSDAGKALRHRRLRLPAPVRPLRRSRASGQALPHRRLQAAKWRPSGRRHSVKAADTGKRAGKAAGTRRRRRNSCTGQL
jgi:hypothetical protein